MGLERQVREEGEEEGRHGRQVEREQELVIWLMEREEAEVIQGCVRETGDQPEKMGEKKD